MDTDTLYCFIATADLLNFGRAAEMLHLSQSALSRKIAGLEAELGGALFTRSKPQISLTPMGAMVLSRARRIVALADEMRRTAVQAREAEEENLLVGYLNMSQFMLLARAMDAVRARLPHVNVHLRRCGSLRELRTGLRESRFDLVFDMCAPEEQRLDAVYTRVSGSRLYAVLPSGHALAGSESLDLAMLRDEPWVTFRRSTAPRIFDGVIRHCADRGFSPNIVAYGESMEEVIMLVGVGKGICLMDETARILESRYTRFVPVRDAQSRTFWYLVRRRESAGPHLDAVCGIVEETASAQSPDHDAGIASSAF